MPELSTNARWQVKLLRAALSLSDSDYDDYALKWCSYEIKKLRLTHSIKSEEFKNYVWGKSNCCFFCNQCISSEVINRGLENLGLRLYVGKRDQ